jgi:hypothetical protein
MFGKTNPFRFVQTITSNLLRGIAGRQWGIDPDAKAVETSRYSYATNLDGQRFWFSKPAATGCGATLDVVGYPNDSTLRVRVKDYGRIVWEGYVMASEAKAWAAVLSSAAVRAVPSTGRRMDRSRWADQASVTADAGISARAEASLFDIA